MRDIIHNLIGKTGAEIGHNTAVIKAFWFKVRRAPKGCPFDAVVPLNGMQLANPAGMIYECLVDRSWGMGAPDSLLDQDSFIDAAATLLAEGFGLAALWHKQQTVEDFIGVILDHIEATLALDPFTGKFRLKLIRGDYDVETLPVFGPHNAELSGFELKAWGETVNEINVSWTNPVNEQTETVTVHDSANISVQGGGLVSETRDYFAVRTADLALRIATRDLLAASSALSTAEMRVNRAGWRLLPGDMIVLNWPLYGIEALPMRIGGVDYGRPGDSKITLNLIEDVFGLPDQSYVVSSGTAWVEPTRTPEPLVYEELTSAPYYVLALAAGEAAAEAVPDTSDYDLIFGTHPSDSVFGFEAAEQVPDANGNPVWVSQDTVGLAGHGELIDPLIPEVSSLIPGLANGMQTGNAVIGALLWIGGVDATGELTQITANDATGTTLRRGQLDTVPREWPAGTPVWILNSSVVGSSGTERSIGETAVMRYLTRTSQGLLAVADAADVVHTMTGRLHRPYRPGNFRVDGVLWPSPPPEAPVTLTWSGRNRLEETTLLTAWDDASVTPEAGVTYTLEVDALQSDGTLIQAAYWTIDGLTGESYEFDPSGNPPPGGTGMLDVKLYAVRDGLRSWQPATQRVLVFAAPYNLTGYFTES